MGRRKIEIKPIQDDRNRSVTFLKRKGGLFKKAHELSVLCSVDVAVIIFGHNKKLYEYSSSDIGEILGRYQYYGVAHEHKGPQDFADKRGGGDEDEDDEDIADEGDDRETPEHPMMHPQMQNHPGFQHVRNGTPSGSPPMHNGPMPQLQRGVSPVPHPLSRPSSRASQHPHQHMRHSSSGLNPMPQQAQGTPPQPSYAYTPNPPIYNPQAAQQMQRPPPLQPQAGPPGSYPQQYPGPPPNHPHMQQAYMPEQRPASLPTSYPQQHQPPPAPNMQGHVAQDHLQPPPQHMAPRRPSPQPQEMQRNPNAAPQQAPVFASPPPPQPKPIPAHAQTNLFTPIDDSRSLLAQHWGATNADTPRSTPPAKSGRADLRSHSLDTATQRPGGRPSGSSPPLPAPRRSPPNQAQTADEPSKVAPPARSNTSMSDTKRPRLKVQIPSEQSGDEGGTAESAPDDTSTAGPNTAQTQQQTGQPSLGPVLPPPSPSAGALLSAGAQGPPNPFARPAPPNPLAPHRDGAANNIETPISALPSRFMSDNLLPSPSTFYPEWGFGRSADGNMLPSPLNFQTPIAPNGFGWRDEDRKRSISEPDGGDAKRAKT